MGEWSGNSKTFYPVYSRGKELFAYYRTSHDWQRMPSQPLLSVIPRDVLKVATMEREGALVLAYHWALKEGDEM